MTSHPGRAARLPGMDNRTHTVIDSPIGELTLVVDGDALVGLYLDKHKRRPRLEALGRREDGCAPAAVTQLGEYFAGTRMTFDLPLRTDGAAFQQRVWATLADIPYGQTRSYGQVARELGDPALAQAVGAANALNPVSIVLPCHRVVGADGALVGYAGGLERKRFLLDHEQSTAARLF